MVFKLLFKFIYLVMCQVVDIKIDYFEISGISGVEWDAVELPSQFLENFAWEYDTLSRISEHKETGKFLNRRM